MGLARPLEFEGPAPLEAGSTSESPFILGVPAAPRLALWRHLSCASPERITLRLAADYKGQASAGGLEECLESSVLRACEAHIMQTILRFNKVPTLNDVLPGAAGAQPATVFAN